MSININVDLSGGLELLFDNVKRHKVTVKPSNDESVTIRDLLAVMKDELLVERPELFLQNNTVRPGILVLINDIDWEVEGGIDSVLEDGDAVTFVSTLHGG